MSFVVPVKVPTFSSFSGIMPSVKRSRMILTDAPIDGDTVTVRTMLSEGGALSLMNYQDENGSTPLHHPPHRIARVPQDTGCMLAMRARNPQEAPEIHAIP
jgi:hypothetical protein